MIRLESGTNAINVNNDRFIGWEISEVSEDNAIKDILGLTGRENFEVSKDEGDTYDSIEVDYIVRKNDYFRFSQQKGEKGKKGTKSVLESLLSV